MPVVMVVDDEKSIRLTLQEFLKREGYDVITASNLENAKAMIDEYEINTVLTDIIMPKGSGVSLLQYIYEKQQGIQVIMMTGEPTVDTAVEAVRLGARDYLSKPICREELLKTVNHAVRYKLLLDEKERLEIENQKQRDNLIILVDERTRKLKQAMINTAYAAAAMIDLRDPYTAGHQKRVGALAGAIGKELGLSEYTIEGLYLIGCIHDIGKITVPTDILNKPSKLSVFEYEIIKEHAEKGYNVLKDFEMPWPVADVVYEHHERLDGSGYPRGLSARQIRLETCVISVADVVEAMMTHRPYRPSLGQELALKEIGEKKGILYHPDVVDACIALFRENGYVLEQGSNDPPSEVLRY